ncbi:MAG: SpoIIE family protein phosphatase [Candidatus Saganbacteria bacterium]|nr:SpoIIE family protein phosphatase [Candidatus Saganbacteria bacterium]
MKITTLRGIRTLLESARKNFSRRLKLSQLTTLPYDQTLDLTLRQEARAVTKIAAQGIRLSEIDPVIVAHEAALRLEVADAKIAELRHNIDEMNRTVLAASEELSQRPTTEQTEELRRQTVTLTNQLEDKQAELLRLNAQLEELRQELSGRPTSETLAAATTTADKAQRRIAELEELNQRLESAADQAGRQISDLLHKNEQWQRYGQEIQPKIDQFDAISAELSVHRLNMQSVTRLAFYGAEGPRYCYSSNGFTLLTDVGSTRTSNEDSVAYIRLSDGREVFIVADGMGGHAAGEVASKLVIRHFLNALEDGETLDAAINIANDRAARLLPRGAGSTLVAAVLDRQNLRLQIAHVGDSRAKLVLDDASKEPLHLTLDHSSKFHYMHYLREQAGNEGIPRLPSLPATESEIQTVEDFTLPPEYNNVAAKNVIATALGQLNRQRDGSVNTPTIRITEIALQEADRDSTLLLYSDGAIDNVPESELTDIARSQPTDRAVAEAIRDNALGRSYDNISVIAVRLPFTLDLTDSNSVEYPSTAGTSYDASVKAEQANYYDPLLSLLSPNQRGWLYRVMERIPGLDQAQMQLISEQMDNTGWTFDQITALPLEQQLRLLADQPLKSNVRQQVIDRLCEKQSAAVLAQLTSQDLAVAQGARAVTERYLRRSLQSSSKNTSLRKPLITTVKTHGLRDMVNSIAQNPNEVPQIAAEARHIYKKSKPGLFG